MRAKVEDKDCYVALYLKKQGFSNNEIAKQLNRHHKTIGNILKRYQETGSIKHRHRSGRPKISNARDNRALIKLMKENRTQSSSQLAVQWKLGSDKQASARTVRRVLQNENYLWRSACKKPRLSKKHIKARKQFCKDHKSWSVHHWRNVMFSDEMNVEVDHRKCRIMLRRTTKERFDKSCIQQRTKQGSGSIGIWACMTYNGVGFFKLFDGRLNSETYIDILGDYLLPSIDLLQGNEKLTFQQDNAPCHKSRKTHEWFAEQNIEVMKWPANSPDLNCIENLWSWLDSKLGKIQITNLNQLKDEITNLL